MKARAVMLAALALLLGAPAAQAQGFWIQKPYQEWTRGEVNRMLTNSPWTARAEDATRAQRQSSMNPSLPPPETRVRYVAFLNSALPVRQALVRRAAMEVGYDELSPEEKQNVDRQGQEFLAMEFPETILLTVNYSATDNEQQLAAHWSRQRLETVKDQITLVGASGRRVQPLGYQAGEGQFQLIFPRTVDGAPIIEPNQRLQLEIQSPNVGGLSGRKLTMDFRARNMVIDGKLIY